MIIIGSKAMLATDFTEESMERFNNSDYDVIMSVEDFNNFIQNNENKIVKAYPSSDNKYKVIVDYFNGDKRQYEIELALKGTSSAFLLDNIDKVTINDLTILGVFWEHYKVLSPEYQYLTKKSHIVYPVHFEKNIADYHRLRESNEFGNLIDYIVLPDTMREYYRLRSEEAKERYKKFKTPKLNVTNEDFFSSKLAVPHYFIHDHIHEMVKHHDRPVYEMMKRDFDSAWCEEDMFFELPHEMQVQCVQEEAYTIALERYIIPHAEGWEDPFDCYKRAVKRICTTLCSGWFRDFAINNYPEIIARYDVDFVKKFKQKFENGEIQLIEGKTIADLPEIIG